MNKCLAHFGDCFTLNPYSCIVLLCRKLKSYIVLGSFISILSSTLVLAGKKFHLVPSSCHVILELSLLDANCFTSYISFLLLCARYHKLSRFNQSTFIGP